MDLMECRQEINRIDSEILRLFEKRMQVTNEVAAYKIRNGLQVLDPAREEQNILRLQQLARPETDPEDVRELFSKLMALSRKKQHRIMGTQEES